MILKSVDVSEYLVLETYENISTALIIVTVERTLLDFSWFEFRAKLIHDSRKHVTLSTILPYTANLIYKDHKPISQQ